MKGEGSKSIRSDIAEDIGRRSRTRANVASDILFLRLRGHYKKIYQDLHQRFAARKYKIKKEAQVRRDFADGGNVDVFLCGDSHAELIEGFFKPDDIVNGAVVGATSKTCADLVCNLHIARRARFSVLIIGTNDIGSRKALSKRSISDFEANVARILDVLKKHSNTVLVAALPPANGCASSPRSAVSVETYSEALEQICLDHDCRFFDPFVSIRSERFGLAIPNTFCDGLHLNGYGSLYLGVTEEMRKVRSSAGSDRCSGTAAASCADDDEAPRPAPPAVQVRPLSI